MKNSKKYRNEWKYICHEADIMSICSRLTGVLDFDTHGDNGSYTIHSLYFDDYADTCALETEAGVGSRYKYRIRYYGNNPEFLRLERKEKLYGRCYKKSCRLSPEQYQAIISGEYESLLYDAQNPVLQQFCICAMTRRFVPKVIIDYERTAFAELITNIRVTADRNIAASYSVNEFLTGDYLKIPVMDKNQHILEVKFDHILPRSVKNIITRENLIQTSFSKYYLGRKRIGMMGVPIV